jgi:hypothetical protein
MRKWLLVLADGLNHPRGLFYDADGVLWIAEVGTRGEVEVESATGPVMIGDLGRILSVDAMGGDPVVALEGLPNKDYFQDFQDLVGAHDVIVADNTLWVLTGEGPGAEAMEGMETPFAYPFNSLIAIDWGTGEVTQTVDLGAFETENNPDNDDVASNPVDMALAEDGTVYIVDASANALLRWTADGGLEVFHVWEELPVPTAIDIDAEGNLYVSFLSAFPFPEGGAMIEKWSPEGELVETLTGLTAVTDVKIGQDGGVYAVQLGVFGEQGWTADSGSVVMVSADGVTPVAEGLNFPYRLAQAPDGSWAVTLNSAYSEADSGQVIRVGGGM